MCFKKFPQEDDCIKLIENQTTIHDYVLLWGAETKYNFLTSRKSPSKYSYQLPLFKQEYCQLELKKFILDIKLNKPKLIIDTSTKDNNVPPLNEEDRLISRSNNLLYPKNLSPFFNYVNENYKMISVLNDSHWKVYIRDTAP